MSNPQNPPRIPKPLKYMLSLMLLGAVIACVLVIVQSCSVPKEQSLRQFAKGELNQMQVLETPPAQPSMTFKDVAGKDVRLTDFRGKVVLLNVWATWCIPCIAEIPSLATLNRTRGGDDFTVIAVSMDRHIDDARAFYAKEKIETLPLFMDPTYSISTKVGVQGIPISIFYGTNGQELARIAGDVDWQSPDVADFLDHILIK